MKVQKYLEQNGTKVILTRSDDSGIFDGDGSIRSKKNSDLKNREKIVNESHADAFVSIHMNKFSDKRYSGPQVFFSANNEESKVLAEEIQKNLIEVLKPQSERKIKKSDNSIYLLKQAQIPAVLVECGFLSNTAEEQKLLKESYQKKIAWAIYTGILQYIDKGD